MLASRRGFLSGLVALTGLALLAPVENLTAPPRDLLAYRSVELSSIAEHIKRLYSPEFITDMVLGESALLRLLQNTRAVQ